MRNRSVLRGVLVLVLAVIVYRPASSEVTPSEDQERKLERRAKIAPVDESTGVAKGLVIAYGHVIRPPYRFRYEGSKLLVNGVQLIPSPVSDRESEKIRARVTDDRRKLLKELERVEARAKEMYAARRSPEEILQFVKSQSGVIADAKWEGERSMTFRLAGDKHFMHMLWFDGLTQATKKQVEGTVDPREVQRRLVDQYERDLTNGVCLFFSSDNGVMRMDDPRAKVAEVMQDKSLSDAERERAVLKIFPMNRIAAYDVLANYSASEWVRKQK